jgi:hypothetical protein
LIPDKDRDFRLATTSKPIHPLIQLLPRTGSSEAKRLKRDNDGSFSSTVDFKITWSYSSNPPYAFIAWYLNTGTILRLHKSRLFFIIKCVCFKINVTVICASLVCNLNEYKVLFLTAFYFCY